MKLNKEYAGNELRESHIREEDVPKWKELSQLPDKTMEEKREAWNNKNLESRNWLSQKMNEHRTESQEKLRMSLNENEIEKYMDRNYAWLMNEVKVHSEKARKYEREANDLERNIQRGKVGREKMQEVRQLRRKADMEKREAESCKRQAQRALEGLNFETKYGNETIFVDGEPMLNAHNDISFGSSCAAYCQKTGTNSSKGNYSSRGR